MDTSITNKKKYLKIVFIVMAVIFVSALSYYQFMYLPQQKKADTVTIIKERNYLTPAESNEMRAAYEEIMWKKYGKKVETGRVTEESLLRSTTSPSLQFPAKPANLITVPKR